MRAAATIASIAVLILAASAVAQAQYVEHSEPTVRLDCANQMCSCEIMTDQELLDAAASGTFGLGSCYFHDKCQGCACNFYVKVSYYPSPSGWDGGTGCLDTIEEVIQVLRDLCASGTCCCPAPNPQYKSTCGSGPVFARDPVTGSCCGYNDACEAPGAWELFFTEEDCLNAGGPALPLS